MPSNSHRVRRDCERRGSPLASGYWHTGTLRGEVGAASKCALLALAHTRQPRRSARFQAPEATARRYAKGTIEVLASWRCAGSASAADAAVLVGSAGCAAESFVAAAVGDAAQLLDVYVDQFTGPGAFAAACRFAGGPVQRGQGRQAVAAQNVVGEPQTYNLFLDSGRGAAGLASQAAGAVAYPRWTVASEASGQRKALAWLTWKRSAARRRRQPSSTTHRARCS